MNKNFATHPGAALALSLSLLLLLTGAAAGYIDQNPFAINMSTNWQGGECAGGQATINVTLRDAEQQDQPVPFEDVNWEIRQSPSSGDALSQRKTTTNSEGRTSVQLSLADPGGQRKIRAWVTREEWFSELVLSCTGTTPATPKPTATPGASATPKATPNATTTPRPTRQPTEPPQPTDTPTERPAAPTEAPTATDAPTPTDTAAPLDTPEPTEPPLVTDPPATEAPQPTEASVPTAAPTDSTGGVGAPATPAGQPVAQPPAEQTGNMSTILLVAALLLLAVGVVLFASVRMRRRPWAVPPR